MKVIENRISAGFLKSHTGINWQEVRFGIEHELLTLDAAVELAVNEVMRNSSSPSPLLELASLPPGDVSTKFLVDELASKEPKMKEERPSWQQWSSTPGQSIWSVCFETGT
jgi:hypothetical protein